MDIDVGSIVEKMNIKKLIEEKIESKIEDYIDIGEIVSDTLEDEKFKDLIHKRVADIIEAYLSSYDGKKCVIEKFKEAISDPDIVVDDRISDIIVEFLKTSLSERLTRNV